MIDRRVKDVATVGILRFIPNALSLSRIVFGVAFPLVPHGVRPWLIAVAGTTDALDGCSARALGMSSATGRLLDPIADKVFVILISVTLVVEGAIQPWWAIGIAARDVIVLVGSASVLLARRLQTMGRMYPTWLGKCTTAAQFAVLFWVVCSGSAPGWLLAATTALSVAAALHYAVVFIRASEENTEMNSIMVIHPYKFDGTWVFDDPKVGLVQEPFVAGADRLIDQMVADIPNADQGVTILFSAAPFPGCQHEFLRVREEHGGNWYSSAAFGLEGWLCPALFKYFDQAPARLYAQAKPKQP